MTTIDVQQLDLVLIDLALIEPRSGSRRSGYNELTLAEYVLAWERGVQFPPIDLYFDGEKYYLADGFHRVASRKRVNLSGSTIAAIVHQGTRSLCSACLTWGQRYAWPKTQQCR